MSCATKLLRASPSSSLRHHSLPRRPCANAVRMPAAGSPAQERHTPTVDCLATLGCHNNADFEAISADRGYAVSKSIRKGYSNLHVEVWDMAAKSGLWSLDVEHMELLSVAVAAMGTPPRLVLSSANSLCVYDVQPTAYQVYTTTSLYVAVDGISSVAITADGRCVASCSADAVQVWNVGTKACVATLEGFKGLLQTVAVTSDLRHAMFGLGGKELQLWDLHSAKQLASLDGDSKGLGSLAVTGDGRWAVTGSADELKVWDLKAAAAGGRAGCAARLKGTTGAVTAVAVGNDDRLVVTVSSAGDVQMWDTKAT